MVQQARKREGEGDDVEDEEEVYNGMDSSTFGRKESHYVHKNLTPTDSLDSNYSQNSTASSGSAGNFVQEDSNQHGLDQNCNNNIEDCKIDHEAIHFDHQRRQNDLRYDKKSFSYDPENSGCSPTNIFPATSTLPKQPIPDLETNYTFGSFEPFFGKTDLNSNTKANTSLGPQEAPGPLGKPRALNLSQMESLYTSGEWIRPLGKFELVMATGGYYGSLNTIQALRIVSTKPIRPDVVRHAVTVLARCTELLQVSVGYRWLWPWFRRMSHVKVPFCVENEQEDVMPAYYDLLHKPYDMARGPLWRARLVPTPQTSKGIHKAVLMFTIHHCITDAFTNMLLCRETLKILNASMSGRVYLPELRPVMPAVGDDLIKTSDLFHAAKFAIYKFYTSTFGNYNKSVYFNGAFPQPATTQAKTKVLYKELTKDATQRLLKHCKAAGTTVHATIMTLAQLAMVNVAHKRSGGQNSEFNIRVLNCVNMRRYFPKEYQNTAGCYISIEEQEMEVSTHDASSPEKLWSLVSRVHESLHRSLSQGVPVRNQIGLIPCTLLIPFNYSLTTRGKPNLNDSHIVSTNMGDLTELLPAQCGEGPVKITHLLRCVSDNLTGHPYTLVFHTFLGRFSFCLEYYTNKTDENLARQFYNVLSDHISDVASHGAIQTGEVDRSANFNKDKF